MNVRIRPATAADRHAIAAFTQDTFEWGDYVADRWDGWLTEERSLLVVAVDAGGTPIATARGIMLSDTELWLHAARVRPDHRGIGIGSAMNDHLVEWGAKLGARLVRLLIETWNEAAQRQVTKSGYRRTSEWLYAHRAISHADPSPTGNGGTRVSGPERLKAGPSAEVGAAYMAWSTSELTRAGRSLFGSEWRWRTLTIDDLEQAVRDRTFYEAPSGWAIIVGEEDDMAVPWMMATPDDTVRLVRAVLDRAIETGAATLRAWIPDTPQTRHAFERIGCELAPSGVWERLV